jgi:hypothetical protein
LAPTSKHKIMSDWNNLEKNLIGNDGCEYLSKAVWPHLAVLNLYKNTIGSEGVKHLRKANWPLIKKFIIGKHKM